MHNTDLGILYLVRGEGSERVISEEMRTNPLHIDGNHSICTVCTRELWSLAAGLWAMSRSCVCGRRLLLEHSKHQSYGPTSPFLHPCLLKIGVHNRCTKYEIIIYNQEKFVSIVATPILNILHGCKNGDVGP